MSTNYYLRKKPTIEQVTELKDLIDKTLTGDCFKDVLYLTDKLYGLNDEYEHDRGTIHIGKYSGGWKFLWCPNVYTNIDGEIVKTYELTKEGLTNFIMQDSYVLIDEYGTILDKQKFLKESFETNEDDYDSLKYNEKYPDKYPANMLSYQEKFKQLGYTFRNMYQTDFYSDGLRFSTFDVFI